MMLGIPQNHAILGEHHPSQNIQGKYCSWCLRSHFTVDKENGGLQKMSMRILSQNHKTARENKHGISLFFPVLPSGLDVTQIVICIMKQSTA